MSDEPITGPTTDAAANDAAPASRVLSFPAMPVPPRPVPSAALTLGQHVMVKLAPGATLINNESGAHFEPDTPTPQTVTVTLLRRLADGDLLVCPSLD